MKTKDRVLELLEESGSAYRSGQSMAEQLFVTRASVWKAIRALEADGYEIEAVTNRGYRLKRTVGLPDSHAIRAKLEQLAGNLTSGRAGNGAEKGREAGASGEFIRHILVYESVESTNDAAVAFATEHPGESAVIIAGAQTKGRGRRGKQFFSPDGTGLYVSFLVYPELEMQAATRLTCLMAVSVCEAIRDVTGIETKIKWVNDIFLNGKKIAGILSEGTASIEDQTLARAVIGVGINLYEPLEGFPEELRKIAGALMDGPWDAGLRDDLAAALILRFGEKLRNPYDMAYVEAYRARSFLIGHYVTIDRHETGASRRNARYAYVVDVEDDCRLRVRYDDGREECLSGGEVSTARY